VMSSTACTLCDERYSLYPMWWAVQPVPYVMSSTAYTLCDEQYSLYPMWWAVQPIPYVMSSTACALCDERYSLYPMWWAVQPIYPIITSSVIRHPPSSMVRRRRFLIRIPIESNRTFKALISVAKCQGSLLKNLLIRRIHKIAETGILASSCLFVCPSARKSATTGRILTKLGIRVF